MVNIVYSVANLHTGFNKTDFNKWLFGVIDFLYCRFIIKRIKSDPFYLFYFILFKQGIWYYKLNYMTKNSGKHCVRYTETLNIYGGDQGYTLLMRPNKVETAVQCFCMSHAMLAGFSPSWSFNLLFTRYLQ